MKAFRKITVVLLVIAMVLNSVSIAFAEDDEGSDGLEIKAFEPGPILNDPVDYSAGMVLEAENIRSGQLLNSVLQRRLEKDIDSILNYQPVQTDTVSAMIHAVDDYLQSGGYSGSPEGVGEILGLGNALSAKANLIGLTETRDDLIEVIETDDNATGYIFVIDRDSLAFAVQDKNGNGIGNALVTISYKDVNGTTVTRSQYTTSDKSKGLCAFDKMKDVTYVVIDVQADGYRAQTVLDKRINAGDILYYQLESSHENDVYLRCADLGGKDILFEDTLLSLVDSGSSPLKMRIIVTATGSSTLPDSVSLKEGNTKRSISRFSHATSVTPGAGISRMYESTQDWMKKGGILKPDDLLSFEVSGESLDLLHARVRNALFQPGTSDEELPLTGSDKKVPFTDVMGGTGVTAFTFRYLKLPVTIGIYPEGGFILIATLDIESLSTKYSSLFEDSWNPKTRAEGESVLEPFKQEFWRKADRFKSGTGQMNDSKRYSLATDKYWSFNVSFSLFCSGVYNEKTGNFDGSFGGLFDAKLAGGVTQYFLVSTPIVIPFYLGFTVSGEFKSSVTANFVWNKLSDGIGAAFAAAEHPLVKRHDLMAALELYLGVGLKGAASLEAAGGAILDLAAITGTLDKPGVDATRFLIDSFASLRVTASFAFFNWDIYKKTFGPWRIWDSHPDKELLGVPADEEAPDLIDTDLAATNEKATLLFQGTEDSLSHYAIESSGFTQTLVNGTQTIRDLSVESYGDSQIQIVSTKRSTALFRIAVLDGKARLIYQKQDPQTGKFMDDFYELPALMGWDVAEFDVSASEDDHNYCYIGCVVVDSSKTDPEARALSSRVQALIVDLDEDRVIKSQVKSPLPDFNKYFYFNPRVAGCGQDIAVAYQKALSYRYINSADACLFGTNEKETVMGKGKIYTSGVISGGEPSFFLRNRNDSSSVHLYIDGYRANGYFDANDPMLRYSLNVSGYQLEDDESYISNWGYQNGTNYAIIAGKLYYLEKYATDANEYGYGMRLTEVEKSEGLINRENIYEFVMTDDASGLCLVATTTSMDVDMETGDNKIKGSTIKIYTLEAQNSDGKTNKAILHGPLDIFVEDIDIGTFAAVFNRENCESKGLSVVYADIPQTELTEEGKAAISSNIYQWQQNLKRGMTTTFVGFEDLFFYSDQFVLPVFISYQNIGYAIEGPVAFTIKDETGYDLHELYYHPQKDQYYDMGTEVEHSFARLFTGDTYQCELLIGANPNWEPGKVHEVHVEIAPAYRGDARSSLSASIFENKLTLQGEQIVLGDKHYADLSVVNIGEDKLNINKIAVETRYKDVNKEPHVSYIDLSKVSSDPDYDRYTVRYDLQPIWDKAEEEGILSVRFFLTDSEGQPLTGESVFMTPKDIIEKTEPVEISYEITEGADAEWKKGSDTGHVLRVVRNIDEEICFSHFLSFSVDGKELVQDKDYTAEIGSTVITIDKAALEELSTGDHDLTVTFDDGEASTTLTVTEDEAPIDPVDPEPDDPVDPDPVKPDGGDDQDAPPGTGDTNDMRLWISLIIISLSVALVSFIAQRNKTKKEE